MPSSSPRSITSSAPTPLSAMSSMASYTEASGAIERISGDFCLSTSPTVVVISLMVYLGPRIITAFLYGRQSAFAAYSSKRYHRRMESLDELLREAEIAHGHLC